MDLVHISELEKIVEYFVALQKGKTNVDGIQKLLPFIKNFVLRMVLETIKEPTHDLAILLLGLLEKQVIHLKEKINEDGNDFKDPISKKYITKEPVLLKCNNLIYEKETLKEYLYQHNSCCCKKESFQIENEEDFLKKRLLEDKLFFINRSKFVDEIYTESTRLLRLSFKFVDVKNQCFKEIDHLKFLKEISSLLQIIEELVQFLTPNQAQVMFEEYSHFFRISNSELFQDNSRTRKLFFFNFFLELKMYYAISANFDQSSIISNLEHLDESQFESVVTKMIDGLKDNTCAFFWIIVQLLVKKKKFPYLLQILKKYWIDSTFIDLFLNKIDEGNGLFFLSKTNFEEVFTSDGNADEKFEFLKQILNRIKRSKMEKQEKSDLTFKIFTELASTGSNYSKIKAIFDENKIWDGFSMEIMLFNLLQKERKEKKILEERIGRLEDSIDDRFAKINFEINRLRNPDLQKTIVSPLTPQETNVKVNQNPLGSIWDRKDNEKESLEDWKKYFLSKKNKDGSKFVSFFSSPEKKRKSEPKKLKQRTNPEPKKIKETSEARTGNSQTNKTKKENKVIRKKHQFNIHSKVFVPSSSISSFKPSPTPIYIVPNNKRQVRNFPNYYS